MRATNRTFSAVHLLGITITMWSCSGSETSGEGRAGASGRAGNGGGVGGKNNNAGGNGTGATTLGGAAGHGGGPSNGGSGGSTGGSTTAGKGGNGAGGSSTGGLGGRTTGGMGGSDTGGGGGVGPPLDCGSKAIVLENAGPPKNRVNYLILGDGYTESDFDSTYTAHLKKAMTDRFSPIAEPHTRYRKFVNICALKVASPKSGIPGVFEGRGDDTSRLAFVNVTKVKEAIKQFLPPSFEVDWTAVVLHNSRWWNQGGNPMLWSGGHANASHAALHEGGHTFHNLADEYVGGGPACDTSKEPREVNVTIDRTGNTKWKDWLGFSQEKLGAIGAYEGGRYCNTGIWRPSKNSEMNQLPDAYNMPSREKIIQDIYKIVSPLDSWTNNQSPIKSDVQIQVEAVDPKIIKVDWSVDGKVVQTNGGPTLTPGSLGLSQGEHKITARAYDDTEWVRGDRSKLEKTVEWTVTVP